MENIERTERIKNIALVEIRKGEGEMGEGKEETNKKKFRMLNGTNDKQ